MSIKNMKKDKNQMGLALGSLFTTMHLLWIIVVALGWGEKLIMLAKDSHFVISITEVGAFSFMTALWGLLWAFIGGYITGYIFAYFWNMFSKK